MNTTPGAQESPGGIPTARSVERQAARRAQVRSAPKRIARNFVQLPSRINPIATLVAALLIVFMVVSLATPLRNYFEQRNELAQLAATIEQQQAHKAALEQELDRYNNDNFLREQARTRLGLIEPGESAYRIISPSIRSGAALHSDGTDPLVNPEAEEQAAADQPWYLQLWDSVSVPEIAETTEFGVEEEQTAPLQLPTIAPEP